MDISGDVSFHILLNKGSDKKRAFIQNDDLEDFQDSNDVEDQAIYVNIKYVSSEENISKENVTIKNTYKAKSTDTVEDSKKSYSDKNLILRSETSLNETDITINNAKLINEKVVNQNLTINESKFSETEAKISEISAKNESLDPLKFKVHKHSSKVLTFKKHKHKLKPTIDKHKNNMTIEKDTKLLTKGLRMVTSGTAVECVYQYPERQQLHALLSDMTNQLTKLCLPAMQHTRNKNRRRNKKRFSVVGNLDSSGFERAFTTMIRKYQKTFDKTINKLKADDPCKHQKKLKRVWTKLLKHSEAELQKATLECTKSILRTRSSTDRSHAVHRLRRTLAKELALVHYKHLETLCDKFQLCFNELL